MLWIGHISGIKITGINHKAIILKRLLLAKKTMLPTSGIMVNAGTFVNMASPKNIPEAKTIRLEYLESLECSAVQIHNKRNGSKMESSNILLKIHDIGITANSAAETNATFCPYLLPAILYVRNVSATASKPMTTLGTRYSVEMELTSPEECSDCGYPMEPSMPARKI